MSVLHFKHTISYDASTRIYDLYILIKILKATHLSATVLNLRSDNCYIHYISSDYTHARRMSLFRRDIVANF